MTEAGRSQGAQDVRKSAIYLLPALVGAVVPLVTLPLFTRILSPGEYGAWAVANAFGLFVSGVCNFGLVMGFERNFFAHPDPADRSALLYSSLGFVAGMILLAVTLTWVFSGRLALALVGDPAYAGLVFLAVCATAVASLKMYFLVYLRSMGEAASVVRFTIDETVLGAVLALILVVLLRIGVIGMVLGPLVASTIVISVLTLRFLRRVPPRFDKVLLKDVLALSLPLTPRLLLGVIGAHLDKYLIARLGSLEGVGMYAVGQRVSALVMTFTAAIENVFAPGVYQRMFGATSPGGVRGKDAVGPYLTPFAFASVGAALAIALFSEEVITVVTPGSYHGAILIANIFVAYYAVMFFGKQPQLVYSRRTAWISALSMVTLALTVPLQLAGIRLLGAPGAALAVLVTGVFSVSVASALGQRLYRIAWEWRRLVPIYGWFLFSTVAILAIRELGWLYGLRLGVKVFLAVGYVVLGTRLGIVNAGTIASVREALFAKGRFAARPGPAAR